MKALLIADDDIVIENAIEQIKSSDLVSVTNKTQGYTFTCKLDVTQTQRDMLLKGGRLNQIKESLK